MSSSEKWRQKSSSNYEESFNEEERVSSRVSTSVKGQEDERSDERHRHRRHKHHKKHGKKKSKSRSPSRKHKKRSKSRSRSRSRERDRSSRSRHRGSGSHSKHGEDSKKRDKSKKEDRVNRSPFESARNDSKSKGEKNKNKADVGDSSSDEDLDTNVNQPFTSFSAVPPAAAKLKAEIDKRKALWSKKDKPAEATAPTNTSSVWKKTAFSGDNDGKVTAKFKRLMGIKDDQSESGTMGPANKPEKGARQDYFADLEKQYEVARATTHTQRGLGLGFSSRVFPR